MTDEEKCAAVWFNSLDKVKIIKYYELYSKQCYDTINTEPINSFNKFIMTQYKYYQIKQKIEAL